MYIRKATEKDLSRIAEIYVFNNRLNYYRIFKSLDFSFGEMQVTTLANGYFADPCVLDNIFVYDEGIIKAFVQVEGKEIRRLYVDPLFQSEGIGSEIVKYVTGMYAADSLWVIQNNARAVSFFEKEGFVLTDETKPVRKTKISKVRMIKNG